jgi:hypothetical protein
MHHSSAIDPSRLAAFDEVFVVLAVVMFAATFAAWFLKPGQHVHPSPTSH